MDLIKTLTAQYMKPELPAMRVGDTVRVTVRVNEATVSVRRPRGHHHRQEARRHQRDDHRPPHLLRCWLREGFPVHSPTIVSVDTVRRGKVRRAKLYYLRDRVGKRAKVKSLSKWILQKKRLRPLFAFSGCFYDPGRKRIHTFLVAENGSERV